MSRCVFAAIVAVLIAAAGGAAALETFSGLPLYRLPATGETRWATFENPDAEKGAGGQRNQGAKGSPFGSIGAGETLTLLDVEGSGLITRIWITSSHLSPAHLRAMRIDMYWDGEEEPAVSSPLGDFFGAIHGVVQPYETIFVSSPEGKSFNCYFPMPYRDGARITITNESDDIISLIVYEINFLTDVEHSEDVMYFHAHWRRERWTTLGEDFTVLPHVEGKGRYLGTHIGVIEKPGNRGWWGEGEVKIFLDGDTTYPTLCGTGTEDYVGTGWGFRGYEHSYQGGWTRPQQRRIGMYRYHTVDPVFFKQEIRITMQQMGNIYKHMFAELQETANVKAVAICSWKKGFHYTNLLEPDPDRTLETPETDEEGVLHYREDDVCAVTMFYLDRPANGLPPLAPVGQRTQAMPDQNPLPLNL